MNAVQDEELKGLKAKEQRQSTVIEGLKAEIKKLRDRANGI